MWISCFCSLMLKWGELLYQTFHCFHRKLDYSLQKAEEMPWTTSQHQQTRLLFQWQKESKSGLARRTGIKTTRRKYRRVKDFPKHHQNNAFVFSLVFISQGQAFTSILHCSSLPVYFPLHPILQASSPPTVIKSPVKNLRWVWKASPAHNTSFMSSKDLAIGCHNPTKFFWAEIRAVLLFRSSHDQNNKKYIEHESEKRGSDTTTLVQHQLCSSGVLSLPS